MNEEYETKLLALKRYAEAHIIDVVAFARNEVAGDDPGFVVHLGPYRVVFSIENQGHHRGHILHMSMSCSNTEISTDEQGNFFFDCGTVVGFKKEYGKVDLWHERTSFGHVVNVIQPVPGTRGN